MNITTCLPKAMCLCIDAGLNTAYPCTVTTSSFIVQHTTMTVNHGACFDTMNDFVYPMVALFTVYAVKRVLDHMELICEAMLSGGIVAEEGEDRDLLESDSDSDGENEVEEEDVEHNDRDEYIVLDDNITK